MSLLWLEELMYQVSGIFLGPVLLLLVVLFAYACLASGAFVMQSIQRRQGQRDYKEALTRLRRCESTVAPAGFPLLAFAIKKLRDGLLENHLPTNDSSNNSDVTRNTVTKDELDVAALKELEGVRAVSRLAPMLGLIATMVPMGPALKSLSNGNIQGISDNLIVAFSAVIFGLVIASITFWIASYQKRWLAVELVDINSALNATQRYTLAEQGKADVKRSLDHAINPIYADDFSNTLAMTTPSDITNSLDMAVEKN